MIQGVHHTSFTVSDLEEAEGFFTDLMGMQRVGGGIYDFDYIRGIIAYPDAKLNIAVLAFPAHAKGDQLLELIEYMHPTGEPTDTATNRPGNAHLCFVVSDIESEVDRLRKAGVVFKSAAPHEVTWGINKGAKGIYFNGPDGIALELLQPAAATS
jgi:catechol 2,3-dioxygenase-like lactoylglutathione lyase family enzyme